MASDSNKEQGLNLEENLIADNMIPNIPVVKKEVLDYHDNEFEITPVKLENLSENITPVLKEGDTMSKDFNRHCAGLQNTENSGNKLLICNRIILGSKPNRVSVDEDDEPNDVSIGKGTQLNRVGVNANYFEELVNCCSEPNVVLQDIQSYLYKSKRFCKVCSILFPEPSGYDNHVEIFHTEYKAENSDKINDLTKRKQYKCTICAKFFVAGHVLRRHVKNIHKVNENLVNENTEKQNDSKKITHSNLTDLNTLCFHCKKSFDTQKSLIEHLYEILQMKRKETEIVPVLKSVLFKCHKCDINFTSSQFAAEHAEHMEMLVNWKCGICSRIFKKEDELSHAKQHSVTNHFKVHNLGEIDVSKILFKCSKCGVHFSESNFLYHFRDCGLEATKSVYCKVCDILLDYNTLHESDKHTESNNFTIISTDVISDNPVKSTVKETTHNHTELNDTTITSTDVISDDPVKSTAKETQTRKKLRELHKSFHEVKVVLQKIDSSKLNVYFDKPDTNKITTNPHNDDTIQTHKVQTDKESKLWPAKLSSVKKHKNTSQKYKWNSMKQGTILEVVNKEKTTNADGCSVRKNRIQTYFYCDTCKCFITYWRKEMHKQGLCIRCQKFTCKVCGLILTCNSRMTHRRLHESKKDLQLKSFTFCNLYNGRSINPPVPEYPECTKCAVRFLTKSARKKHVCSEETYLSCDICKTKLSEAAFKLHMPFHQYSIDDAKRLETTEDAFTDHSTLPMDIGKIATNAPEKEVGLYDSLNDVHMPLQNSQLDTDFKDPLIEVDMPMQNSSPDTELQDGVDMPMLNSSPDTELQDGVDMAMQNSSPDTELQDGVDMPMQKSSPDTELQDGVDMPLQNSSSDKKLSVSVEGVDTQLQHSSSNIKLSDLFDEVDMQDLSPETYKIIYTCVNCSVTVDTYDKAIEHCQEHYKNEDKEILTEVCTDCNLKIDHTCYTEHLNLHKQENGFKFLKFDSYYLPAENDLWVKHIFKTLPNEKVFDILSQSIYRFECRIKMDVIQQGDPDLTLYKCDQCACFIEPNSLFKHSDNSCFKLRQHPCTHCGIPFISSTSRIEHETLHNRPGVTIDSYRIVVFNREQDKQINRSFCLHKKYVLYKCRNCDVIIDKLQRDFHQCDFNNVKKCPYCALLVHSMEYEKHINAHKEFVSFNYSNMKVVILGEDKASIAPNGTLKSTFKGAIYDYKMYICNNCEICVKSEKCIAKHSCNFEAQRSKCSKCGLYFSVGRLKTHLRSHERDPEFLGSNMNKFTFEPRTVDQNKNATVEIAEECEDSNTDSDSDIVLISVDTGEKQPSIKSTTPALEETATIFKCPCALHFLNEDSIFRHFGVCKSKTKISKHKCPKCGLLFTPNILFTHMLAHHSNKSRRYKYDIVEMDNTQISMLQQ